MAIARLGHMVESRTTAWNLAANCHSEFLEREKAALIVDGIHTQPVHGGLKPSSLVERGIESAD
jgi:hypothetical protein